MHNSELPHLNPWQGILAANWVVLPIRQGRKRNRTASRKCHKFVTLHFGKVLITSMLINKLGRRFYELWLFITVVCNVKCNDCLTESYACNNTRDPLAFPEIKTWANAFASLGTSKIRITPDDPSLIKDSLNIMNNYIYVSDSNHLVMLDS